MYFLVGNAIVDRDDLTIYEKMACVVLARYTGQDAFHDLLTLEVIARKMRVTPSQVKLALEGLVEKGLILRESAERITQEHVQEHVQEHTLESNTPHKAAVPVVFESFDANTPQEVTHIQGETSAKAPTSDEILRIFEEVLTKRQALILFELAGRNLNVLEAAYRHVKSLHPFDLVEALSEYLQKPQAISPVVTSAPSKVEEVDETEALFEALEKKPKTQVNLSRIHALYQQQKQMKQP